MSGNSFSNIVGSIPPVTRNLIIINLLVWLVEVIFPSFGDTLVNRLGLHYFAASLFNPVQLITYLFIHAPNSPWHVLFNMFTLWMFGSILEHVWGSRRYFIFYFVCGIGAGLVQELVWAITWMNEFVSALSRMNGTTAATMRAIVENGLAQDAPDVVAGVKMFLNNMATIGASGAVFGVILGFAMVFPDRPMYLYFIPVPIKAKYMMIGYAVLEFFLGVAAHDMVAHFAHLGGLLFGLLLILYWRHKGILHGNRFY